jgi:hypothetical protein
MTNEVDGVLKIEIAKALRAVRAIVSESDFEKVRGIVAPGGVNTGRESGPCSHRAAGVWLATALPLTAERADSAMGFKRGNEELERGAKTGQNVGWVWRCYGFSAMVCSSYEVARRKMV